MSVSGVGGSSLSIREIARRVGCSAGTVSRVLSGKEKEFRISARTAARIREICSELGYRPSIHASRLFSGRSGVIGFLSACPYMPEDENFTKCFFHFCEACSALGYRVLPMASSESFLSSREYLSVFARQEIDGMVVWGCREGDDYLAELASSGYPLLLLMNRLGELPAVYSEQVSVSAALTRGCLARGASRVAGIVGEEGDSFRQRAEGVRQAVGAGSCAYREWQFTPCHGRLDEILPLMPEILAWEPDAIVCCNDAVAAGVCRACLERGLGVPDDILVTGGDNIALAEVTPVPLTTFDQRVADCARTAARLMVRALTEGEPLQSQKLASEIIWRQSLPER